MIRVLHVIDHLGLGGAQAVLLDLVRCRDASRISCEVACLHGWGPFAEALAADGIPVHSLASSKWSPAHVSGLLRLAGSGRFDVFHFHLQASNWLAKSVAALAGFGPRVAHDHSSADLRFRGLASLAPDAVAHIFSDHVIAVSPAVRDLLIRWEAVDPASISIVPNGVDLARFRPPSPDERAAARSRLGLASGTFAVGALGRLAPEKNFTLLAAIAAQIPEAVFVLGGEGPCRAEIAAAAAGLGDRLRLVGAVGDRPGFLHALDAFALVSLYEGLPIALLEAMACGLPVVASELPDLAEALERGRWGALADPASPLSFVGALERLRTDPAARRLAGERARQRCAERFSARSAAEAIGRIYSALCSPQPVV